MNEVLDLYKGSRSDDWETPDYVYGPLNKQYGFTCDLAANPANTKCPKFYSQERSFLAENEFAKFFGEVCWMNPPFSLAEEFFAQVAKHASYGTKTVAIFKSSNMETGTWQKYILPSCSWIFQPDRRVHYVGAGKSAPFPSAIVGWNLRPPVALSGTLFNGPFERKV